MFGKVQAIPQVEDTPFYPRSPYGVAKLYAHWMTVNYRESYGIFGSSGILFNHESRCAAANSSPARSPTPWPRSSSASSTCWNSATSTPSATGVSPRNTSKACGGCCRRRAGHLRAGHQPHRDGARFRDDGRQGRRLRPGVLGLGRQRDGRRRRTGKTLVRVNPKFYRPAEVDLLIGDPAKAQRELGWEPKTTLEQLCPMMVEADLRRNAGTCC